MLAYLANVLMITSIGGWNNINLVIIELRVPPNNVAAVLLMVRTISVFSGALAPSVSILPAPIPYLVLLSVSTAGLIASLYLPEPG